MHCDIYIHTYIILHSQSFQQKPLFTATADHLIMFIKRMLVAVLVAVTFINALAKHNPKYKGVKAELDEVGTA